MCAGWKAQVEAANISPASTCRYTLFSTAGFLKTGLRAGFEGMVQAANRSDMGRRNGGAMLSAQSTERALLTNLLARLRTLDADVYVGHNISAFDLDVLLHRLQHHKVHLIIGHQNHEVIH